MFTTYGAAAPSLYLDIDRAKAQSLGLTINDVFTTLQATLGSYYVNNFNLFGRTWQVNLEGEAGNRRDVPDLWRIYIRNSKGTMVPLQAIASPAQHYRSSGHHALQQLSLGDRQRHSGAGRCLRHGARRHGGHLGEDAAGRFWV